MGPTHKVPSFLRAFENRDLNASRGSFPENAVVSSIYPPQTSSFASPPGSFHRNRNRYPAEMRPKLPSIPTCYRRTYPNLSKFKLETHFNFMLMRRHPISKLKFWVELIFQFSFCLIWARSFYFFSHGGRTPGTIQFRIFFFFHLITFIHLFNRHLTLLLTDLISFSLLLIPDFEVLEVSESVLFLYWKTLHFWLFDSLWLFSENDGSQKGLCWYNSEHGEGGSSSCNGIRTQSSLSPAGSLFCQGWSAQDAPSLEEHDRYKGNFSFNIIFTLVFFFLICFQDSFICYGCVNWCAFVNSIIVCVSDGLIASCSFLHCISTVKFYYAMTCSSSSFLARIIQWLFGHFDYAWGDVINT